MKTREGVEEIGIDVIVDDGDTELDAAIFDVVDADTVGKVAGEVVAVEEAVVGGGCVGADSNQIL